MITAAAYIRVSTDEQTEHSPDSQLKELKDYAARHDLLIDSQHIYVDSGISGRKAAKRPEFQKMISAAKNKPSPFEVILVWKFSRFARNQEESILYKSLLRRDCGVDVVSITEETNDNVFGSLIERIIEWMDEFYSIRLAEEVRTKMTYVAQKGISQTVPPFGYARKDNELVIVPEEAEWVRFMADSFLDGKSLRWIATQLNNEGVKSHRGNAFEARTVEYILKNVTNYGAVHWTPDQTEHDCHNPYSQNTIIVENACPAIYDRKKHNAIMAELTRRANSRKKYDKPDTVKKHWLSGFLKCSNCGASMVYSAKNKGFQCYKYAKGYCPISHFVSAAKIETAVIEAIEVMTINKAFVEAHVKPQTDENQKYIKDIDKYKKMLERAKNAYIKGIDTIEEYSEIKKRLTGKIEELKKQIVIKTPSVAEIRQRFRTASDVLRSDASNDVKRAMLSSIVEKIIYSKSDDSIKIFFSL